MTKPSWVKCIGYWFLVDKCEDSNTLLYTIFVQ